MPIVRTRYLGAWAILPMGKVAQFSSVAAQYLFTALVIFFGILRLVNCGVQAEGCHPVFSTCSALYHIVLCHVPLTGVLISLQKRHITASNCVVQSDEDYTQFRI